MTTPTVLSSRNRVLFGGLEASFGTGPGANLMYPIAADMNRIRWDPRNFKYDADLSIGRRYELIKQVAGRKEGNYSISGPIYPDTFGMFLKAALGDAPTASRTVLTHISEATAGDVTVVDGWSHVFQFAATPPSMAFWLDQGVSLKYEEATGCLVDGLTIEWDSQANADVAMFSADLIGKFPTITTVDDATTFKPYFSPPADRPFAAWKLDVTRTRAGQAADTAWHNLLDFSVTISNNVQAIKPGVLLHQDFSGYAFGTHSVRGRMTMIFSDYTEYTDWLNDLSTDLTLELQGAAMGVDNNTGGQQTTPNDYKLVLDMSEVYYQSYAPQPVGEFLAARVDFRAVYVTGDLATLKATLRSRIPTIGAAYSSTADEALAANDLVTIYDSGAGVYKVKKANAAADIRLPAHGFVAAAVLDEGAATVYFTGPGAAVVGQTANTDFYLSDNTAGGYEATVTTTAGALQQKAWHTTSATRIIFQPGIPTILYKAP